MTSFGSQDIGFKEIKNKFNVNDDYDDKLVTWEMDTAYDVKYDSEKKSIHGTTRTGWTPYVNSKRYIIANDYSWQGFQFQHTHDSISSAASTSKYNYVMIGLGDKGWSSAGTTNQYNNMNLIFYLRNNDGNTSMQFSWSNNWSNNHSGYTTNHIHYRYTSNDIFEIRCKKYPNSKNGIVRYIKNGIILYEKTDVELHTSDDTKMYVMANLYLSENRGLKNVKFIVPEYKIFDPPYSHHSSPYIYNNNNPGELRAETRISETTSGNAWVMRVGDTWGNDTHVNQNNVENSDDAPYYYQIDLSSGGNIKNYVSGVVTAGRRNGQYVTKWKYQYYHNNHWHWVDNGKIFNGNNDDSSEKNIIFSIPVYTTGIRFFPIATANNNVSSRMALLIEHEIFDPPYNHHSSNAAKSLLTNTTNGVGMDNHLTPRLNEGWEKCWAGTTTINGWSVSVFNSSNKSYYWQIDTSINNALKKVAGVVVKGRYNANNQYVTKWNFQYSTNGSSWIDVPGIPYDGNNSKDDTVFIFFTESVFTTGIRFCPTEYNSHPAARMALLMSKDVKANELKDFDEIFDPPYTHHSSKANGISSVGTDNAGIGRLSETYNSSGWVVRIKTGSTTSTWGNTTYINANNDEYYWQIDITADGKGKRLVKGVVTKGRRNGNSTGGDRVTQLKLQYSNGINWYWVDGGYTFKGNDDPNTNNFIYFTKPVVTTGIRFFPTAYVSDPSMRMALILDNKLYSSALQLSEPFNKKELLDIEWGYHKGFTSIQINNKIHTLFAIDEGGGDESWSKNYLISKTSYPVENNIYELSLKNVNSYITNTVNFYYSIDFNNEVGANTSNVTNNLSNYRLYNYNGYVMNNGDGTTTEFGSLPTGTYSKILIDGINGKVQFVVNDVLQTTKEFDLTTSEKTGKFYVKVVGYSGKAVLRLRKLDKHPFPTNLIKGVNSIDNMNELDIEWGTTLGFTSTKIAADGREKVYQLTSSSSGGWGSHKLISSTSYPMKDNIYILSGKLISESSTDVRDFFFGIDYSTNAGSTYLHNFIRYQVYFQTSTVTSRLYNEPHTNSNTHGIGHTLTLSSSNHSNTYVDMILDGINGKVQFVIGGVKQSFEHTMNDNDLNGRFYVKVDMSYTNKTNHLSFRKYSYCEYLKVSENFTDFKNVTGIALKGLSDQTYIDEVKLDRIQYNKVEWNPMTSGTNIVFHADNSVTSTIDNSRTEAYFTSKQKIYYSSDKVQGVRFKAIANNKNVFFGIGEKGYFTRKTHANDPRKDIRYAWYCNQNGTAYTYSNTSTNSWPYTSDTIFDIRVDGLSVSFYMDNVFKKTMSIDSNTISPDTGTSTTVGNFPFYVMSTIYNTDGGVKDVELYGDWMIPITKDLNLVEQDEFTEKIEWYPNGTAGKTEYMDITDDGTTLRRADDTSSYKYWYSYATSVDTFTSSFNYYQGIKCKPYQQNGFVMFGLKRQSVTFSQDDYNDDHIDYGFYINTHSKTSNIIRIYESGTEKKDFQISTTFDPQPSVTSDGYLPRYSLDDVFEVRVKGTQVEYLINDIVIYYSNTTFNIATSARGGDIIYQFATANNGSLNSDGSAHLNPHDNPGITSVFKTKQYVSNIEWGTPTDLIIAGNSIVQSSNSTSWDSSGKLKSASQIERNDTCWQGVEFQPYVESWGSDANNYKRNYIQIGLGNADFSTDGNYGNEIEYLFYLLTTTNTYNIDIIHLSSSKWNSATGVHYTPDDKFRILVKGDTIRYIINDSIVYEEIISNGIKYPLYIKIAATSSRRGVKNVKLITKEVEKKEKENHWSKNIVWGASLNMNIISNNHIVSSSDQTTWNSYIKSFTSIERDDLNWQGIKFQTTKSYDNTSTSNPNRYYTRITLGHLDFTGTTDFHFQLTHPFYIRSNDTGTPISVQGDYGSNSEEKAIDIEYTEYDIFQMMVKGEQVRYIINGVVHHELTRNDFVYPLNIKIATTNSSNEGIRNVQILRSNTFKTNSVLDPTKQRNILFDYPIEANSIRVTPLKWHNDNIYNINNYGEIKAILSNQNIGDSNTIIYDPDYQYHSTNSANMVYLNGTSNSLGLYDRGRLSEPDLVQYPLGYSSAWIPNILNNDNSYGSQQSSTTGGRGNFSYEIETTTNSSTRYISGVAVKGGYGEELDKTDVNDGWVESENEFINKGGHLISIHSLAENQQLSSWAETQSGIASYPWIGGLRQDTNGYASSTGNIKWTDGTPYNYEKQSVGTDYQWLHLYKSTNNNWTWGTHWSTADSGGFGKIPKQGYVTKWKFKYLNTSDQWIDVDGGADGGAEFTGITSSSGEGWGSPKQILFATPVYAKKIRFIPWEWNNICAARMGLLISDNEINIQTQIRNTSFSNDIINKNEISEENVLENKKYFQPQDSYTFNLFDTTDLITSTHQYAGIGGGEIGETLTTDIPFDVSQEENHISIATNPIYWDYTYGLTVDSTDNTKITKTSGENWNSFAISRNQPIYRNEKVWQGVKYNLVTDPIVTVGLGPRTDTVTTDGHEQADFSIYHHHSTNYDLRIYEGNNGNVNLVGPTITEATNSTDIFEVRVKGDVIQYLRNNIVFYTSTNTPSSYPLYVKAAVYRYDNDGIENVEIFRAEPNYILEVNSGKMGGYAIDNYKFYDTFIQKYGTNSWYFGIFHGGTGNPKIVSISLDISNNKIITTYNGSGYASNNPPPEGWYNKMEDYYNTTRNNAYHLRKLNITIKKNNFNNKHYDFERIIWDKDNDNYVRYEDNETAIYNTYSGAYANNYWNTFAISKTQIKRDDDCWQVLSFQLGSTSSSPAHYTRLGIGHTTRWNIAGSNGYPLNYYQVDFQWYIRDNNDYSCQEGTLSNYNTYAQTSATISTNDIYEIKVKGDIVQYFRNGSLVYTSTKTPIYPLYIKYVTEHADGYSLIPNQGVRNVKLFKEYASNIDWDIENAVNINITDEGIINNTISNSWNGLLFSKTPIYRQDDHYQCVKYQITGIGSTVYHALVGFGNNSLSKPSSSDAHYIQYGLSARENDILRVHEGDINGNPIPNNNVHITGTSTYQKDYGSTFTTDDWFEIRIKGTTVEYLYNDNVIYTSIVPATFPLYIEVIPYSTSGNVKNVQFYRKKIGNTLSYGLTNSFKYSGDPTTENYEEVYNNTDVVVNDISWNSYASNYIDFNTNGGITTNVSPPINGDYWPAYAMSNDTINQKNYIYQGIKFQKKTLGSEFAIGLSQDHANWIGETNRYGDIDFAFIVRSDTHSNVIEVYEKNNSPITVYTSSTPETTLEDIFEVRVKSTTVEFLKNNAVFYTSAYTALFPLRVRSAVKNGGIKNVQIYTHSENVLENVSTSDISWNYTYGLTTDSTDNTKITKTSGDNWNSFAISTNQPIYRNENVWQGVKYQFVSGTKYNMTGLGARTTTVTTNGYHQIDFALYVRPTSNIIEVYEGSGGYQTQEKKEVSQTIYNTDIFEVRVKGDVIQYLRNNIVFYTSTNTPSYPLYVKSSSNDVGDGIENVQIYKYEQQTINSTILSEYNQQNIQWNLNKTSNINFNADGSITRYATLSEGWYSWTVATEKIYQNNDVYQGIKCNANQTYGYVNFGLKNSAGEIVSGSTDPCTYGMYINAHTTTSGSNHYTTNAIKIRETTDGGIGLSHKKEFHEGASTNNPNNTSDGYLQNYTTNDILEVRVKGTQIEYLVNNVVIYYSTINTTFPLYPFIISWGAQGNSGTVGGEVGVKNVQLTINHSPYAAKSELSWDTNNSHYIDFNSDGSITSNLSNDWRSRTISHQLIHYNPNLIQGIRFQTNTYSSAHKAIGLGVDTNWQPPVSTYWNYNAIHFATYINSSSVKVYESDPTLGVSSSNAAVNRGTESTTSTADDIFEIRVIGKTVEYVKNGEVYHTSVNEAVFPLYVKACLYSDGFKNIELFKDRYPLRRVEWDENHSINVKIDNTRKVIKNGNVNAWDSNCFSIQKIERNDNIWQGIRFQSIKENLQNYGMFGLGKFENALSTSPANYFPNIKYAIFFFNSTNDSLRVYENGDHRGDYCNSSGGYSPNDLFEIRVKGKFIEYLKNSTVFRNNFTTKDEDSATYSAPPFVTYPLYASGAFANSSGKGVKNVEFFKHVEWDLQHSINMEFNHDGSITKPYTDKQEIFNSGITSKDYILRDNDIYQGIKFKFKPDSSNKTFVVVGLSPEKEWNDLNDYRKDVDYGIYFRNNEYSANGLAVRENNIHKWAHSTTYTQNNDAFDDMFEIRVKGTTIEYLKNGVVLYTSAKEATFPLYVKIGINQRQTYADRGVQYVEMYSTDDLYNKCKQGDNVLWDKSLERTINYDSNFIGATATDSKSIAISLQSIQYNATVYQGIQFQLFNGGYCHVGLGRKYSSPTLLSYNYYFPEYLITFRSNRTEGYSFAIIENDRDTNTKYHPWPYDGGWDKYQKGYRYNDDDIWEIRVLGNTVEYLLNGEVFYTSEKSVPSNAWPLHLIYAPNNALSSYSDNPDYQGIRNVKFINYSKGFYLTNKNYFQDVKTSVYDTVGISNEPIKMWKNIHDGHVSTKEDNNALQIFSKSPGSESIDGSGNKNVYRAKFSSEIVSETFSENIVTKGIWFQFELNTGYQCIPSNIKMSYVNLHNAPRRFTLFGSNNNDVSMYPKTTTKWEEIKQCQLDLSNNSILDSVNKTLTFNIDMSVGYSYFRMVVTHIHHSDTLSFYNLQLNGNVLKIN